MPIDDQTVAGLILGAVFWVVLFGAAVTVGGLAFFLFGSTGREVGTAGARSRPGGTIEPPQPAEEGGRLDEWSEDRLDRAA